jgi:signal transduction histidine kinase
MMAVSGAGMAAAFLYPYDVMIRMATLMAIPGIGVMMASGVMSWRKGFTPARFYLTAWTVFLAGQFIYAVHKSWGLFSGNFLALYGGQIGSGLEVVLLSLALADRINVIQAERHVARERAIKALEKTDELNEKLREYSRSLEQRVKDRTRELSLANEKLKALDAMKSDFLANVSHELRTPLTSVLGFATMIQEKLHDLIFPNVRRGDPRVDRAVAKVGRNVGIIVSESERLTDLINNVLDLSKMEAGRMDWDFEPVPLDPLVRRAAETFEYQADQTGVRLSVECEPGLPLVMADTDRLFQVLVNLLSNALKFTSQGSVGVRVRRTNRSVTVSVFDSGVGIRDEDKELVFDKFRQVGDTLVDKPKGTGLGLPICKQIVEHHGGRIWVEDAPNGGSVFSFNLPDTDANAGTDGGADIGTDGEEVRSGRAANRH